MTMAATSVLSAARFAVRFSDCRTRLVAGLALAFELASPLATAGTVTSCDDGPNAAQIPGTLRYEIANAPEGGTVVIDPQGFCLLPKFTGSVITLETGAITITQNSLTIQGPANGLTIAPDKYGIYNDAEPIHDRVFNHQGNGLLTLKDMTLTQGDYYMSPTLHNFGGCLYSKGSLYLQRVTVTDCQVRATATASSNAFAYGGAVYALGNVVITSSTISGSKARNLPPIDPVFHNEYARCGGLDVLGYLTMTDSTIAGNYAKAPITSGGGACVFGGAKIIRSTISGNTLATGNGQVRHATAGGIYVSGSGLTMTDSTISGNRSSDVAGGILSVTHASISGSTIAFNSSGTHDDPSLPPAAAGLTLYSKANRIDLMVNTIIANNVSGPAGSQSADDLYVTMLPEATVTIAGATDLVLGNMEGNVALPGGSISGQCPLLGPLRANGGPTKTHALLSGSPAIDAGVSTPLNVDQRGLPRESPSGHPDIGAYEVQQDDVILDTGFDGC